MNFKKRRTQRIMYVKCVTRCPARGSSQPIALMMVIITNRIGQCFSTLENPRFLCEKHTSLKLLSSSTQDLKCQRNKGLKKQGETFQERTREPLNIYGSWWAGLGKVFSAAFLSGPRGSGRPSFPGCRQCVLDPCPALQLWPR